MVEKENIFFKGNPNLKAPDVKIEFTAHQIQEYVKCSQDPVYFIENYCKIVSLDDGIVLFKMHPYQKRIIEAVHNNRNVIAMLFRQAGKSTTMAAYLLWYATFNDNTTSVLLANKLATAREIFDRVQLMYELLPPWLKQGIKEWNKTSMKFENGAKIKCAPTSASAVRGMSINLLVLDEFAFLSPKLAEEFIASVFPTLSSSKSSKLVMVSCVTKDTMVFTKDGIKTVEDFVDSGKTGAYYVPEYEVLGKDKFNRGSIMVNNGRVSTKIIGSSHSELECSHEHKLWVCRNGVYDWVKAKDLKVGDWISIQYGMNIWGNNDSINFDYTPYLSCWRNKNVYDFKAITPDLAYLMGLYIAEGYIDTYRINIACGDNIGFAFDRLGIKFSLAKDGIHYIVSSKSLCDMIRHLGFDTNKKAKEKEIPKRLLSMSRHNIIALLQGMFDGDGCATTDGGVSYVTTSKKLAHQIQVILNNLGILCSVIKTVAKPTKRVKVESTVYEIWLSAEYSKKFYEIVGFQLERKQKRYEILKDKEFVQNRFDVIPFSDNVIRKYHLSTRCDVNIRRTPKDIQRKKFLEIRDVVNTDEWKEFYDSAVSENIYWEKITSITDSENDVFDFSLNDVENDKFCHSVIYNGIVGHQTPNGLNHFYKYWKEAEAGTNGFTNVRGWYTEARSEEWAEQQRKILGEVKFQAEVLCSFQGSSYTLIDGKKLAQIPSIKPHYSDGHGLDFFEAPQKGHEYVLTADTSRGRGLDHSAFIVWDISSMPFKVVCTFKNNTISVVDFPTLINRVGKEYNWATLLLERNDLGESVANDLWYNHEYPNMIWTHQGKISGSGEIGLQTTATIKRRGNNKIKELVERDQIIINDFRILDEQSKYVLGKRNNYEAQDTKINDDLCACMFLFGWFTEQDYFEELTHNNVSKVLAKSYQKVIESELPIGFFDNGFHDDIPMLSQNEMEMLCK